VGPTETGQQLARNRFVALKLAWLLLGRTPTQGANQLLFVGCCSSRAPRHATPVAPALLPLKPIELATGSKLEIATQTLRRSAFVVQQLLVPVGALRLEGSGCKVNRKTNTIE
jgi:hypothetical protein